MRKMAARGVTISQMGQALNISPAAVRRNLVGVRVARDAMEVLPDSEVVGSEVIGAAVEAVPAVKPFTKENPGPIVGAGTNGLVPPLPAHPNPTHEGHPAAEADPAPLTPAQKGAATKAANRAAQARQAEDLGGSESESDFLE